MPATISITATESDTLTLKLPAGLTVRPGQPVPIEVLEMVAAFARIEERSAEAGVSEGGAWCLADCYFQAG